VGNIAPDAAFRKAAGHDQGPAELGKVAISTLSAGNGSNSRLITMHVKK
jgi:hypothetical protein